MATRSVPINGVRHDDSFDLETLLNAIEAAMGTVTGQRSNGFANGPWQIDGGPPIVAIDAPHGNPAHGQYNRVCVDYARSITCVVAVSVTSQGVVGCMGEQAGQGSHTPLNRRKS